MCKLATKSSFVFTSKTRSHGKKAGADQSIAMISLRNALQIITILVSEDDNVRLSFQDLTLKEPFQHNQISRELVP